MQAAEHAVLSDGSAVAVVTTIFNKIHIVKLTLYSHVVTNLHLCRCHYKGRLASNNAVFDSSYERGRPLTFKVRLALYPTK